MKNQKKQRTSRRHSLHGFTLQPINMALMSVLEQIESQFIPILEIICDKCDSSSTEIAAEIQKRINPTPRDIVAATYCFVTPIDQLEKVLETKGKDGLEKHAMETIGRVLGPIELGELNGAILAQFIQRGMPSGKTKTISR